MKTTNTVYFGLAALALLFFISKTASGSTSHVPDGAVFDLFGLDADYGADNIRKLNNLYAVVASSTDPNTGQPLSTLQQQLMLSQALFESGLFTNRANYNLIDNFHNYTGIKGNSRYPAASGSMYVAYPSIGEFVGDWLTILNFGNNPPIDAVGVADFANRLKNNGYFEDNLSTYQTGIQHYFDMLANVAA